MSNADQILPASLNRGGLRLRPARPDDSSTAALLIYMSMPRAANFLFGSKDAALAVLAGLFARPRTRFSYQFSHVALMDGMVVGLILAATVERLTATALPTVRALVATMGMQRMGRFIWRSLMLARVPEGKPGEFYVAHVAVLPAYRSHGIGSALLGWAEEQARIAGRSTVSLIVEIGHERARAFYERHGYVVTAVHETPRLERRFGFRGVYRLEKRLVAEDSR